MHYQGLQKVFQSLLTTTEEDLQQQSFEFKAGTIRSKVTSDALKFIPHIKNDPFRTIVSHFFCRLYEYLSQKCSSNDHFEVSNISKSELAQSLQHEMQKE